MNETIMVLACLLGCWNGTDIYVNPLLPAPIHSYVLTHELCHARHSDIRRAHIDFFYLLHEEIYCHWQAIIH